MKISILDDYQDVVRTLPCFNKIAENNVVVWNDHTKDVHILAERLIDTEILILNRERTPIRAPLIEGLPELKLITQRGAYPHLGVEACSQHGVVVCASSPPDRPSYATAEFTWGLIIAAMRKIPQEIAAFKSGRWQSTVGLALRGRTLGIFSYGRIGALIAGYGKAFGMKTLIWGRESTLARARAEGHNTAPSKVAFFEEADVISLHLRLIAETRGIVTAADLARMKPSALIVNTSRAELFERGALEHALRLGRPGMAAVDVYEEEPVLGGKHPLLHLDNAICTPHIGYVERDAHDDQFNDMFDSISAYLSGKPINVINPAALRASLRK